MTDEERDQLRRLVDRLLESHDRQSIELLLQDYRERVDEERLRDAFDAGWTRGQEDASRALQDAQDDITEHVRGHVECLYLPDDVPDL